MKAQAIDVIDHVVKGALRTRQCFMLQVFEIVSPRTQLMGPQCVRRFSQGGWERF